MPTITYELADGTRTDIKVDVGANVMRTAIDADIPGIVAECGAAAGAVGLAGMTEPLHADQMQKTFILVHGAWHGGWCWRRVADHL